MDLNKKLTERMIEVVLLLESTSRYGDLEPDEQEIINVLEAKLETMGYMEVDLVERDDSNKLVYHYWSSKCYEEFEYLIEKYS